MLKKQIVSIIINSALLLTAFNAYANNEYSDCKVAKHLTINLSSRYANATVPRYDTMKATCEAVCKKNTMLSPYAGKYPGGYGNSFYENVSGNLSCYCC